MSICGTEQRQLFLIQRSRGFEEDDVATAVNVFDFNFVVVSNMKIANRELKLHQNVNVMDGLFVSNVSRNNYVSEMQTNVKFLYYMCVVR